jgi:hypothetical protein
MLAFGDKILKCIMSALREAALLPKQHCRVVAQFSRAVFNRRLLESPEEAASIQH